MQSCTKMQDEPEKGGVAQRALSRLKNIGNTFETRDKERFVKSFIDCR